MPSERRGGVSLCKDVTINVNEMGREREGVGSQRIARELCKVECQAYQEGK